MTISLYLVCEKFHCTKYKNCCSFYNPNRPKVLWSPSNQTSFWDFVNSHSLLPNLGLFVSDKQDCSEKNWVINCVWVSSKASLSFSKLAWERREAKTREKHRMQWQDTVARCDCKTEQHDKGTRRGSNGEGLDLAAKATARWDPLHQQPDNVA